MPTKKRKKKTLLLTLLIKMLIVFQLLSLTFITSLTMLSVVDCSQPGRGGKLKRRFEIILKIIV